MNLEELNSYLEKEIAAFPGQTALMVASSASAEPLFMHQTEVAFSSASTIKTPILLAALEQVRQGKLSLDQLVPVPAEMILEDTVVFDRGVSAYTLHELLYWMVTISDNTATNVILDLLGFDAVNDYCTNILGLKQTVCQRKMLDFAALEAGRNNLTSAADQRRMFCMLHSGQILTPSLRTTALSILTRQRHKDGLLRYISDEVTVAHKGGGLDGVAHDSGIFFLPDHALYVGIFTWDGPSPDGDPTQRKYIGRLSKAIYDTLKKGL